MKVMLVLLQETVNDNNNYIQSQTKAFIIDTDRQCRTQALSKQTVLDVPASNN